MFEVTVLGVGVAIWGAYIAVASRLTLRNAEAASQAKIDARRAELGKLN